MELPELPKHVLALVEERPSLDRPGFLGLRRVIMRVEYADGTRSEPFEYDAIGRSRLDAVVVAAHYRGPDGRRMVMLRSCLRPPLALRARGVSPVPERDTLGALWELPAGLVEGDEQSPEGLRRCAARELHEEVGVLVAPEALQPLGPSGFPAPGVIGERHFFFHVEIDPARIHVPTEDGSALERQARLAAVPLDEALALTRSGVLEDEKTELGLRRLAEIA
jgi:ADP-ribose pyrophosphatase